MKLIDVTVIGAWRRELNKRLFKHAFEYSLSRQVGTHIQTMSTPNIISIIERQLSEETRK